MWVKNGIERITLAVKTGLTIGAFDGVHLGHQALIRWMVTEAHRSGMQAVVLTFDPLPRQVLGRGENGLLSTLEERLTLMEPLEVEGVVVLPFDRETAATPAADFVAALVNRLRLGGLWVGPDFSLGRHQEGDIPFLQEMGARYGFALHVFEENVLWEGHPVRSSRIRRAVKAGDMRQANGCLGRPYQLTGSVGHGEKRGRRLGFPTANLELPEGRLLPANGVYVCRAHVQGGSFAVITNVGTRPTFDHHPPDVEAHLLDFSGDIYGELLRLDFLHRLRAERRFPSAAALVAQIRRDEVAARAFLSAD